MKVGLIGYSDPKFSKTEAVSRINDAFREIERNYNGEYTLVSGLTAVGVPGLAYREAERLGWNTEGVACRQAREYPWHDVDRYILEGEEWGDESRRFLDGIDLLVKIGGGEQSEQETDRARERGMEVIEYTLEEISDP